MEMAAPVAGKKYNYLRVRDDNGEWGERAQEVIDSHLDVLYDDERDFDGLVKLLLKYAPTCLAEIAKLRPPKTA